MQFKLFLSLALFTSTTSALDCYVCDFEEGQLARSTTCENNPGPEYIQTAPAHPPPRNGDPSVPARPDMRFSGRYMQGGRQGFGGGNEVWFPYCVTIVGTRMGRKVVYRDYAWADSPQNDGQCDYSLPGNYENLYLDGVRACYCNRANGCNNETTSELSDLKCYDCFWYELDGYPGSSPDCKRNPKEDKLVPIPRVPQMKLRSSYELSKILDPKEFNMYRNMNKQDGNTRGRQLEVWHPYCVTIVAKIHDKQIIIRGAHWWEESTKNGYCASEFPNNTRFKDSVGFQRTDYSDISACYCNDREGCNGRNTGTFMSFSLLTSGILSGLVFLYHFHF